MNFAASKITNNIISKKLPMKKTITSLTVAIIITSQLAFAQVAKKTIVEHFTNTKCSICASRNPGFYTNLGTQTNVLHLAIHPSSPYSGCLLSQQNLAANDARTNYYGIYGSTPKLVINGNLISPSANYASSTIFTPYIGLTSPASIRIVQEKFATDSIRATVSIKTEAVNTLGALSLFVALAEDTVFYTGSNGEPLHFDVFRKALTAAIGNPVTLPATVGDSVVYTFSSLSNPIWDFSRIFTLAILQETSSKNLVQAEAVPAAIGSVTTNVSAIKKVTNLFTLFPTVAHDYVNVQLNKLDFNTEIKIVDIIGKVVYTTHPTTLNFKLETSNYKSGVYFVQVTSGYETATKRFIVSK